MNKKLHLGNENLFNNFDIFVNRLYLIYKMLGNITIIILMLYLESRFRFINKEHSRHF